MDEANSSNAADRPTLPLAALKAFDAAARLGSFRVAAEALGLTPSAVSHQIKALERALSVALFQRQGRAVILSEADLVLACPGTTGPAMRYWLVRRAECDAVKIRAAVAWIRGACRKLRFPPPRRHNL
jgi:DNA-binding transcriptional ArsR family regulator